MAQNGEIEQSGQNPSLLFKREYLYVGCRSLCISSRRGTARAHKSRPCNPITLLSVFGSGPEQGFPCRETQSHSLEHVGTVGCVCAAR